MRKSKRFVSLLLTLAMMLSVCTVLPINTGATVHTFYVSSTGSDSNDGSENSPFLTVEKAHQAIHAAYEQGDSAHLVFQDDSYFRLKGIGLNNTAPSPLTEAQKAAAAAAYPGVVFIGDSILAGVTTTDKVATGKTYNGGSKDFYNLSLEFGKMVESNIYAGSSKGGFDGTRVNLAVGGETSATVTSRLNTERYPSVFTGSFTIPAAAGASVDVTIGQRDTGYSIAPLLQQNSGGYGTTQNVTIHVGDDPSSYIKGTLTRSGSGYRFTRTTAGEAVEVSADTVFYYDVAEQVISRDGLMPIIMIGNNEGADINTKMHLEFIDAILEKFGIDRVNGRYIVVTPFLSNVAELSDLVVANEKRIETAMLGHYGKHVINMREFFSTMAVYEVFDDSSAFEGYLTADDYERMAAGNVPEALLGKAGSDRYIHLATYSAEMLAKLIYGKMDSLGYFTELKAAVNMHDDLVHVEAKDPTCQHGNKEYWYSTTDGTLYLDAAGTTVATLGDILIEGSDDGHNFVDGVCTHCGATQGTVSPAGNLNVAYVFDNQNNEFRDAPGAYINKVSGNTLPPSISYKTNASGQIIYGCKESTTPQCVTRDQVAASAVKATQVNPLEDVMTEMGLFAARGMLLDVKGTNTLDNATCLTLLPQGTSTYTITNANTCTVTANTPYLVYKISTGDASKALDSFRVSIRTINCNAMRIGAFLTKEAPSYNASGYVDYSASGAVPLGYFVPEGYNNNEKPIVFEATSADFTGDLENVNEAYLILAFNNYGKSANATGDRKSGYATNDVMIESIKFSSTTKDIPSAPVAKGHIHTPVLHKYKPATCAAAGNIMYFTCADAECAGKYYSDAPCTIEITEEATIIPQLAHTYTSGYAADADGHWQTCDICGASTAKVAHTPGDPATCTSSQVCTICGYGITGPQHTLEQIGAHSPTCVTDGNKTYWHCTACDKYYSDDECIYETTVVEMTIPATGIHNPDGDYHYDEDGHWQLCSYCSTDCTKSAHIPNIPEATDTQAQICTICGYIMQPAVVCSHDHVTSHEAVAPTCKTDGSSAYWYCPDCDTYFADEALSEIITVTTTIEDAVHIDAYGITGTIGHHYVDGRCTICGRYLHAWRFGNNIALQDNILLRYLVVFDDTMIGWLNAGELSVDLKVDVNGGTTKSVHYDSADIPALKKTNQLYAPTGEYFDYYVFSIPTAAKQMCDDITITIKHNGDIVFTYTYSVQRYCFNKRNSETKNLAALVQSIVEYGAAAQLYKNYRTDTLATDYSPLLAE